MFGSSAGIGRSGCFIATSIGLQQLREEHMVDVLGVVCAMRIDRSVFCLLHLSHDPLHIHPISNYLVPFSDVRSVQAWSLCFHVAVLTIRS